MPKMSRLSGLPHGETARAATGTDGGETGPSFSYRVIPPSIDNLRVNHCALRADCVCLDRAKGREVVYRKS